MNAMSRYNGSRPIVEGRPSPGLEREVRAIQSAAAVRAIRAQAIAQEQTMKVQAFTQVGLSAQHGAAVLSQSEDSTVMSVPSSSGRVGAITDSACLSLVGILHDAAVKIANA